MISQFLQMMKPPNAGERNKLPMIAMTGLQIVSPCGGCGIDGVVAGIDDPGPGTEIGSGGGPADGMVTVGNGGGFGVAAGVSPAIFPSSVAAALWAASPSDFASEPEEDTDGAAGSDLVSGNTANNSEIGFQAAFASSHARSVALRLPSATFSRMADSEKRPAYCPFRCTQISMPPY